MNKPLISKRIWLYMMGMHETIKYHEHRNKPMNNYIHVNTTFAHSWYNVYRNHEKTANDKNN